MTGLTARQHGPNSGNTVLFDKVLEAGNIPVDQANYSTIPDSTPLDRVYDVRGRETMHSEIENIGNVNDLTYRIDKARKDYATISDLTDADFDEEIKTDTPVVGQTPASGTVTLVSVVGGVRADGTVTMTGPLIGDNVTVNGLIYTGVAGVKANFTEFSIDGTDTASAIDLADSVNNDTRVGTLDDLTADNTLGVVTFTQTITGTAGNATTLVSSNGARLPVSGATFTGGIDGDFVTVNDLVYTAVVGPKANNSEFSGVTDNLAATALALSITDDTRIGTLDDLTASATTNVCTITQTVGGVSGNATTLSSSDGATLAVSGALFTGGLDQISVDDIPNISPEMTAIRVRVKETIGGNPTTLAGIVSVN